MEIHAQTHLSLLFFSFLPVLTVFPQQLQPGPRSTPLTFKFCLTNEQGLVVGLQVCVVRGTRCLDIYFSTWEFHEVLLIANTHTGINVQKNLCYGANTPYVSIYITISRFDGVCVCVCRLSCFHVHDPSMAILPGEGSTQYSLVRGSKK